MKNLASHQAFLLRRASQDDGYLAHVLWAYSLAKGKDWSDILDELDCDEQALIKLALCRNFKVTEPNFAENVQKVANFSCVDVMLLSNILKRSAFLSNLKGTQSDELSQPNIYLAAAREKDSGADSSNDDNL